LFVITHDAWLGTPPAYTQRGCGRAHVGGTLRDSCRYEKDFGVNFQNYRVNTNVAVGGKTDQVSNSENRLEITSGGPGIGHGGCCGFSICYNLRDGTLHVEDENWSGGHHQTSKCICDDSSTKCQVCTTKGNSISKLVGSKDGTLYNTTFSFTWQVYHQSGHVYYDAFVKGQKVYSVTDPAGSKGIIDPAKPISPSTGHEKDYDPNNTVRIRIDGSRETIISGSSLTELVPTSGFSYSGYKDWNIVPSGTSYGLSGYITTGQRLGYGRRRVYQSSLGYIDT
jgi:hypothetical protein